MKFNATLHGDKITVSGVDAFTPIDGDYATFNYLGEDFNLIVNSFPYFEVVGDLGTIAKIETNNENGIKYVKQYMRGMSGVEGALKFEAVNGDICFFPESNNYDIVDGFELEIDVSNIVDTIGVPRISLFSRLNNANVGSWYLYKDTTLSNTYGIRHSVSGAYQNIVFSHTDGGKLLIKKEGGNLVVNGLIIGVLADLIMSVTCTPAIGSISVSPNNSSTSASGDNKVKYLRLNTETFNLNQLTGSVIIGSEGTELNIITAHIDQELHIDNEMHRAIGSGDPALATLSATDIDFDSLATNSGALTESVDYTDSLGEYYPLNEAEGDIAFGEYGTRGLITEPNWVAKVIASIRRFGMALGMAMGIPFMRGK